MANSKRELPMVTAKREVRKRIRQIKQHIENGDHEAAHADEDRLFEEALRAIAEDAVPRDEVVALALLVLTAKKLKFRRDCA